MNNEVIDLTGDSDSPCDCSTPMSVVKTETPVPVFQKYSDQEVIDLTDSPMIVEKSPPKPSTMNNYLDKGKSTGLITDFYSSSPNKKPKISQSPFTQRNRLEVVSIDSTPASNLKLSAHKTCERFLSAASSISTVNSKKEIDTNFFDCLKCSTGGLTPPRAASVDRSLFDNARAKSIEKCPLSPLASRASPVHSFKASSSNSVTRQDISIAAADRMQVDLTMELDSANRAEMGAECDAMSTEVSINPPKDDLDVTTVTASSYSASATGPSDPSTAVQLQHLLNDLTLSTKKFGVVLDLMLPHVPFLQGSSTGSIAPSSSSGTGSARGSGDRGSSSRHDKKSGKTPVLNARLDHLHGRLFPSELSGRESAPPQLSDAMLCIMQDALRLNPACQCVRKIFKEALSRQDARVYIMLAETKCAALGRYCRQRRCRHGGREPSPASGAFDVFGLGRPNELILLLRKLFRVSDEVGGAEWTGRNSGGGGSTHNSGEKATSAKSKSAQRRAEQQQISEAFRSTETSNNAGGAMAATGVVNAGTLKVRTENDARHAIALRRSAECALGLRIVAVWCDYMKHITELIALEGRFDMLVGCSNNIIALLLDLDQLVAAIRSARTKSTKDESVTEKDARYAAAKITELNAELIALLSVQQLQPGIASSQLTYVEEAWQDLLQLSEVFPDFQDWCDVQASRGSPFGVELSQRYVTILIQALHRKLLEVTADWNTLNVADSTLRFLMQRIITVVERAAIVLGAHTLTSSVEWEEAPALKTAVGKLQKVALEVLGRMRLSLFAMSTQARVLAQSSGGDIERQWKEAAELVARLHVQNSGGDKKGPGSRRSREDQLLDVVCALEKKCSLVA